MIRVFQRGNILFPCSLKDCEARHHWERIRFTRLLISYRFSVLWAARIFSTSFEKPDYLYLLFLSQELRSTFEVCKYTEGLVQRDMARTSRCLQLKFHTLDHHTHHDLVFSLRIQKLWAEGCTCTFWLWSKNWRP